MSRPWSHPLLRHAPSTLQIKSHCFSFQTINHETWTPPEACPTIHKSYPGKSIPLDTTTSYLNRPNQHVPTKYNMFSLRLAALILYDSLHGESQICCLGHHREMATATQRRNNTTKQSNHSKATRNIYSNPSRIQSTNIYSHPSRIQSNIPKNKS